MIIVSSRMSRLVEEWTFPLFNIPNKIITRKLAGLLAYVGLQPRESPDVDSSLAVSLELLGSVHFVDMHSC